MNLTRRGFLKLGAAAATIAALPMPLMKFTSAAQTARKHRFAQWIGPQSCHWNDKIAFGAEWLTAGGQRARHFVLLDNPHRLPMSQFNRRMAEKTLLRWAELGGLDRLDARKNEGAT